MCDVHWSYIKKCIFTSSRFVLCNIIFKLKFEYEGNKMTAKLNMIRWTAVPVMKNKKNRLRCSKQFRYINAKYFDMVKNENKFKTFKLTEKKNIFLDLAFNIFERKMDVHFQSICLITAKI